MDKIVKLVFARFSSRQPAFFIKLRNWSFWIGLLAAITLLIPVTYPVYITSALTIIVGVCTGLTGGSSLTTKDEKIIKKTDELFPEPEEDPIKAKYKFHLFKRIRGKKCS